MKSFLRGVCILETLAHPKVSDINLNVGNFYHWPIEASTLWCADCTFEVWAANISR